MSKITSQNASYFQDEQVFKRIATWDLYLKKATEAVDSFDVNNELLARWNVARVSFFGAQNIYDQLSLEWELFATKQGFEFKHPGKNGFGTFQEELDQIKEEALWLVKRAVGNMCKFEDEEDDMFEIELRNHKMKLKVDLAYVEEKYHKYFSSE
jgi:hypothetical protein